MSAPTAKESTESGVMPKLSWPWRVAGWSALALALTIGFMGYFMPDVRLNWETIAAMCGF
jgi:hypothetical protein